MTPRSALTTPDLVVLSLLAEAPMHGYQLATELEQREVKDWAAVSRPQVYYSLRKLSRLALVEEAPDAGESKGPARRRWRTNPAGTRALADALGAEFWAAGRPPPPFLTWLALSHQARPATVRAQFARRARFLRDELARERHTVSALSGVTGSMAVAARWMVDLTIRSMEVELAWLDEVSCDLPARRSLVTDGVDGREPGRA